jgi:hypothetical protein
MPEPPTAPAAPEGQDRWQAQAVRQWRAADRLACDAELALTVLQGQGLEPSEVQHATARQLRAAARAAASRLRTPAADRDRPSGD